MPIETLDRRTLAEPDARAISELLCIVWPKPGRTVDSRTAEMLGAWRDYGGPENQFPRAFRIQEGGRVIGHAAVVPRTIGTSGGDMTIAALARVCVDPSARGRGLGDALVREAFKLVDDGTFPFSLFQTSPAIRPFYEKLGARAIDNRIINSLADDPFNNPFWDEVAMVYPTDKPWPSGEVDLRGPGY